MGLTRDEQLRLAEQVRGTIIELTKRASEPLTISDLRQSAAMQYHFAGTKPDPVYIDRLVRDLWKAGHLARVRVSRPGDNSRFAYEPGTGQKAPPSHARMTSEAPGAADLKVDILKASGRLRVSYRGLTIEIGVQE